ncbi:MAG TPA: GntR family transcriptional regulator [Terracidiphilus sp.]|nr:GntR family transcriptional regulator [Terracidiphilus sp.]
MSTRQLPVVQSVALREGVAQAIRQALLEGRFKPGEYLSDTALAREMNVSRGPVREALLILAQQGLITHAQNHGFSVLGFSDTDHREIDEIRLHLESLALSLARSRITERDLQTIEEFLEGTVAVSRQSPSAEWVKAELEFHGTIWDLSGNRWLASCLRYVMVPYFNYETAFRLQPQVTDRGFPEQHQILLDYLKGASSCTAEECMRLHLRIPAERESETARAGSMVG